MLVQTITLLVCNFQGAITDVVEWTPPTNSAIAKRHQKRRTWPPLSFYTQGHIPFFQLQFSHTHYCHDYIDLITGQTEIYYVERGCSYTISQLIPRDLHHPVGPEI